MAYEVSRLDSPEEQATLAERIVTEKLTRDQTVAAVQAKKPSRTAKRIRQEFRRDDGTLVTISGPAAAAGRDAIVVALKSGVEADSRVGPGHRPGAGCLEAAEHGRSGAGALVVRT